MTGGSAPRRVARSGFPKSRPSWLVRDFNGDGKLDLALASHNSYAVTLLLGDGRGGFAPAPESPVVMKEGKHPHTHGLLAGDLNGDGKLDVVTINSDPDNDISVAFGDGKGGFTRVPAPFAVGPSPYPGHWSTWTGTATWTSSPPARAAGRRRRKPRLKP